MILLRELFEASSKKTNFSAISKETGKLVYFDTKHNMDTAVKDGTHETPKVNGKDVKKPKSSDIFKGDYEKERSGTIDNKSNHPTNIQYEKEEVSKITNVLGSMDDNGGVFWEANSKDILKAANKYGIDVNRILSKPERFSEIEGHLPEGETPQEFALKALGHTASFVNDKTALEDSFYLVSLQLAYPMKYKELSDEEWSEKMNEEDKNPKTIDAALRKFTKDENFSSENIDKLDDINRKSQADWVKEQNKNPEYANDMMGYQQMISKFRLENIDKLLISNPPPPIQAEALYRGMAMKPADLKKFLKNFSEGQDISLPISSFSLDPSVATGFSNNVNNDNALINKSNNQSVLIKVVNKNNTFNGFGMNANIGNAREVSDIDKFGNWSYQTEVLLPSNNQYKTLKVETKEMEGGRSFTLITLEQIGVKNEQSIKLKELIDGENLNNLKKHLQYPNRISLLYKNEGE